MNVQKSVSPWAILAVTSLAVFAVLLDALVLFVAFPAIQGSFNNVPSVELSWVLNAYTIVYAALLVPAGRLADLVGRKRIFLLGALLFTLGSILCGISGSPEWLIAARVAQAFGGAMLTPTSLALTLAGFPQSKRTVAVTLWGAVGALAVVAGPPLGAIMVQSVGWRGIFFLNVPIGLAAVLIGRVVLSESKDDRKGTLPDILGVLLLIAGAGLIAYGIVQSQAWGWDSLGVWGAIALGGISLVAFVIRSSRVAAPALDLTLFSERSFLLANSALFLFSIGFTAMFLGNIYFLTRMWGYSILEAGLSMMPAPLMVVLLAPIAGRIAARRGHRILMIPGGIIYGLGALTLTLTASSTPQFLTVWLPATLLTGIGVALVLPVLSSAAVQQLPPNKLAVGSGVSQALRQFGGVLGVSLAFVILGPAPSTLEPFRGIYMLMIASGLCVSVLSLRLNTKRAASAPQLEVPSQEMAHVAVGFE